MKRGTYVLRSTYQKVVEENRKLLLDIRILTEETIMPSPERILCKDKWQKKFRKDKQLNALLKEAAVAYMKEHPEYDIKNRLSKMDK
jgi:hypothetical protein